MEYIPFASDTNNCKTKAEAIQYMRDLEKSLSNTLETHLRAGVLPSNYYIFGNGKLIATADMYDNATLIAEALASHSPYYYSVDVMNAHKLIIHYIDADFHNDRTNHEFHPMAQKG